MRLFVAIELTDRCGTQPLPPTRDNRSVDPLPAGNHPLAAFVAQLAATFLRLPQTRARGRCAQDDASGSYTTAASLAWPERPTLDRSV
jgi:hypothetical protein